MKEAFIPGHSHLYQWDEMRRLRDGYYRNQYLRLDCLGDLNGHHR
jgi:hypothetical protein